MSEEHLETLVKTMEHSTTSVQKPGIQGDMDDFWDDCVDSKQVVGQMAKKQNHSNKKFNVEEQDLPDDYITCKKLNFLRKNTIKFRLNILNEKYYL